MQHDVVAVYHRVESPAKLRDSPLESRVLERHNVAALGAQQMVLVLAARIGGLESRGAVSDLDALDETHLEQHVEHPVDAGYADGAAALA